MKIPSQILIISLSSLLIAAPSFALSAKAVLNNSMGEKVGTVSLIETKKGVKVKIRVEKLDAGLHGVHFHENAKCEGPDFKTAGGHFNPHAKQHGFKNPEGHHAGDMPNLKVGADGKGSLDYIDREVSLKDTELSIVVHAKEDDQKTNPSGNSGDRIACGVIEKI